MSDKSELKAELERKKQRLAQIREEKKRKEEERKKQAADQLKEAAHHQDDSDLEKKRREAEAILQSMGITADAPVAGGRRDPRENPNSLRRLKNNKTQMKKNTLMKTKSV
uniref:Dynein cytoplasmic 1 intermediate chain 2 n=1 Tax=Gasterosteus aculeatus aculeatus TaxID=481459 RepID=A0AAQ4QED4_GASAC